METFSDFLGTAANITHGIRGIAEEVAQGQARLAAIDLDTELRKQSLSIKTERPVEEWESAFSTASKQAQDAVAQARKLSPLARSFYSDTYASMNAQYTQNLMGAKTERQVGDYKNGKLEEYQKLMLDSSIGYSQKMRALTYFYEEESKKGYFSQSELKKITGTMQDDLHVTAIMMAAPEFVKEKGFKTQEADVREWVRRGNYAGAEVFYRETKKRDPQTGLYEIDPETGEEKTVRERMPFDQFQEDGIVKAVLARADQMLIEKCESEEQIFNKKYFNNEFKSPKQMKDSFIFNKDVTPGANSQTGKGNQTQEYMLRFAEAWEQQLIVAEKGAKERATFENTVGLAISKIPAGNLPEALNIFDTIEQGRIREIEGLDGLSNAQANSLTKQAWDAFDPQGIYEAKRKAAFPKDEVTQSQVLRFFQTAMKANPSAIKTPDKTYDEVIETWKKLKSKNLFDNVAVSLGKGTDDASRKLELFAKNGFYVSTDDEWTTGKDGKRIRTQVLKGDPLSIKGAEMIAGMYAKGIEKYAATAKISPPNWTTGTEGTLTYPEFIVNEKVKMRGVITKDGDIYEYFSEKENTWKPCDLANKKDIIHSLIAGKTEDKAQSIKAWEEQKKAQEKKDFEEEQQRRIQEARKNYNPNSRVLGGPKP